MSEPIQSGMVDERGLEAARDENGLLPCPFCGAGGQAYNGGNDYPPREWQIECSACEAGTGWEASEAEAIAAWNRRASSPNIGEVEVRGLDWKEEVRGTWWTADAYRIELFDGGGGFASRVADPASRAFRTLVFGVSLDEAKAAAQAHFAGLIRSALVPSPRQHSSQADAPGIPATGSGETDDIDSMLKISKLIADLQDVHARFGDTCVYIRRGGMSWGAVALNRQADDKKNGVFDLQATHDKVMGELGAQVGRLKADRDQWRSLYWRVAVKPGEPIPFDAERLLADIEPSPANPAETQAVEVGK